MSHIGQAISEQQGGLSADHILRLRQHSVQRSQQKPLSCGTFFSGCEMFFLCVQSVLATHHRSFGTKPKAQLDWIADKDAWKRDFVTARWQPRRAFGDVVKMSQNNWVGTDYLTSLEVALSSVSFFAAGFECDTVCKYKQLQ